MNRKPSTLSHFVRLDLSLIKDGEETRYFVNEVTRALEMFLFSKSMTNIDFIKVAGKAALGSIKEMVEG